MTLPIEVVELLKRAASHPEGAGALLEGNLESAASLYQVHPTRVEQVRGWLSNGPASLRRESEEIIGGTAPGRLPAAPSPAWKTVEQVIAEARALADGLELLANAPVETAATLLSAHPFVIDEARAQLDAGRAPISVSATTNARPSAPRFSASVRSPS